MPASFSVGQRVRLRDNPAREGRVTDVHDFVDIELDDGGSMHCQTNGDSCCSYGAVEPLPEGAQQTMFEVGQKVIYFYDGRHVPSTITSISETGRIEISFDEQPNWTTTSTRTLDANGRCISFYGAKIEPMRESEFTVGQRVQYCLANGNTAVGEVTRIDHVYVFVKLDEDQPHIRYVHRERAFRLDGKPTGEVYDLDYGVRSTEIGSELIPEPKQWTLTEGREYPGEKPRIGYGLFDGYYRRPLQEGNPDGYNVEVGWGVINFTDPAFAQRVFDTRERAEAETYITTAIQIWENQCLDHDLTFVENQFQMLQGCTAYQMYVHADKWGGDFIFPNKMAGSARRRIEFHYPRACCTAGLMTMDEVNEWLSRNAGNIRIDDVDGTQITLGNPISNEQIVFHVLPKLIEDFKPTLVADAKSKKLLLLNLASQLEARDSPLALAA